MIDDLTQAAREAVEVLRGETGLTGVGLRQCECYRCTRLRLVAARLERAIEAESAPKCCASCFRNDPRSRSAGCAVRRAYQAAFSRTWTASGFWCAMWFPRSKSDDD